MARRVHQYEGEPRCEHGRTKLRGKLGDGSRVAVWNAASVFANAAALRDSDVLVVAVQVTAVRCSRWAAVLSLLGRAGKGMRRHWLRLSLGRPPPSLSRGGRGLASSICVFVWRVQRCRFASPQFQAPCLAGNGSRCRVSWEWRQRRIVLYQGRQP